jgi:CBS domain containing-hemolysin-like protein
MTSAVLNILLILLLVIIGGVFVAAEFALVSLRESQVSQLASRGKRGQLVAKLTANPNLFLSSRSASRCRASSPPPLGPTGCREIWRPCWSD